MINEFTSFESMTGLPEAIGYGFIFLFGSAIGSFLNVVIHRVPRRESIVFPGSACPKCGSAIKAYDNIPIFSWIFLGGKCRNCKSPIAFRYPLVELLTALSWLLTGIQVGFSPFLVPALIFVSVAIALMFIDAEHMILPNVITIPFFLFAVAVRLLFPLIFGRNQFPDMTHPPMSAFMEYPGWIVSLGGAGLGALAGGGSLWLIGELWKKLRGVEAMGLGDVKMMLGFGAFLGWPLTALSIFLGAFSGAVVGSAMVLLQRDKDMQSQIPFGIFLGFGCITALLFGDQIIEWYLSAY